MVVSGAASRRGTASVEWETVFARHRRPVYRSSSCFSGARIWWISCYRGDKTYRRSGTFRTKRTKKTPKFATNRFAINRARTTALAYERRQRFRAKDTVDSKFFIFFFIKQTIILCDECGTRAISLIMRRTFAWKYEKPSYVCEWRPDSIDQSAVQKQFAINFAWSHFIARTNRSLKT